MGDITKIEWAHSTLNLWYGCTRISPACDHCYAAAQVHRLKLGVVWDGPPVEAPRDRLAQLRTLNAGGKRFLARHGERRRIFINSMSDFFDKRAPAGLQSAACMEFERCADVDILLVTKRPQNIERMVPRHWLLAGNWPAHVWLIVTAENNVEAERRGNVMHALRKRGVTISVVGASVEPMLEAIDPCLLTWAHWLIVGGESGGPKSRPFEDAWARRLLSGAREFGQYFFFKQTRNKGPIPGDLMVREFPR